MKYQRYIEIEDEKYFQSDIENMSNEEIRMICSFLEKENELDWVQLHCHEGAKHIIDNIKYKL